jgi:uncharacterized protein
MPSASSREALVEAAALEFVQPTGQGYLLKIHVVPGARQTAVVGLHGGRLKVKVAAPPEKGRANQELLAFLARALKVPLQALHLTSGASSRAKVVAIHDPDPDLGSRLEALLQDP